MGFFVENSQYLNRQPEILSYVVWIVKNISIKISEIPYLQESDDPLTLMHLSMVSLLIVGVEEDKLNCIEAVSAFCG